MKGLTCMCLVNSDSNSTFMVLNLDIMTDSKLHYARNQRS